MLRPLACSFWVVVALVPGAPSLAAAPPGGLRHVDDDAPPGGVGRSWGTAYRFLQDALSEARRPGGLVSEIRVARGLYRPDRDEACPQGTADRDATFGLVADVPIRGGYLGLSAEGGRDPDERDIIAQETILSGDLLGDDVWIVGGANLADNSFHVVSNMAFLYGVLEGFTVTAGNADGSGPLTTNRGAGVFSEFGSLLLVDCTVWRNVAYVRGAGVMADFGDLTTVRCRFLGNAASLGGAGVWSIGGSPQVRGCQFIGNIAGQGAGLQTDSNAVVSNCLFVSNDGTLGAGAWVGAGNLFVNCTFLDNMGSAVYTDDPSNNVRNSILHGNSPQFNGPPSAEHSNVAGGWPGMGNIDADPQFILLAGTWSAGGLYDRATDLTTLTDAGAAFPPGALKGAVVGPNQLVPQALTTIVSNTATTLTVRSDFSLIALPGAEYRIHVYRLAPGSPCIDAADNTELPPGIASDIDGHPRFVDDPAAPDSGQGAGSIVDMGAWEFCRGDVHRDGTVGVQDLVEVILAWGTPSAWFDTNADGVVDVQDLVTVVTSWGPCD